MKFVRQGVCVPHDLEAHPSITVSRPGKSTWRRGPRQQITRQAFRQCGFRRRTLGEPAHSSEQNHVANRPQAGRPCIYALRLGSQMAVFRGQRPWPVWCRVVGHDDQPAASAFSRAPHFVSSYGLRRQRFIDPFGEHGEFLRRLWRNGKQQCRRPGLGAHWRRERGLWSCGLAAGRLQPRKFGLLDNRNLLWRKVRRCLARCPKLWLVWECLWGPGFLRFCTERGVRRGGYPEFVSQRCDHRGSRRSPNRRRGDRGSGDSTEGRMLYKSER